MTQNNSKQSLPTEEYYGVFKEIFRQRVHQLLRLGFQDAQTMIQNKEISHAEETSITGFIVEALQKRQNQWNCEPEWLQTFSMHENRPKSINEKVGKSRPMVDIVIRWSDKGSPAYHWEAKRLNKKIGVSGYVGKDGMGCFIAGKYAARFDEAGMLGYVQSGDLGEWKNKLQNKINKSVKTLKLLSDQSDVDFLDSFPFEWTSEHQRETPNRRITLYHILLDCTIS